MPQRCIESPLLIWQDQSASWEGPGSQTRLSARGRTSLRTRSFSAMSLPCTRATRRWGAQRRNSAIQLLMTLRGTTTARRGHFQGWRGVRSGHSAART